MLAVACCHIVLFSKSEHVAFMISAAVPCCIHPLDVSALFGTIMHGSGNGILCYRGHVSVCLNNIFLDCGFAELSGWISSSVLISRHIYSLDCIVYCFREPFHALICELSAVFQLPTNIGEIAHYFQRLVTCRCGFQITQKCICECD